MVNIVNVENGVFKKKFCFELKIYFFNFTVLKDNHYIIVIYQLSRTTVVEPRSIRDKPKHSIRYDSDVTIEIRNEKLATTRDRKLYG